MYLSSVSYQCKAPRCQNPTHNIECPNYKQMPQAWHCLLSLVRDLSNRQGVCNMVQGSDGTPKQALVPARATDMENSTIEMRLQNLQHCISVAEQQLQVRVICLHLLQALLALCLQSEAQACISIRSSAQLCKGAPIAIAAHQAPGVCRHLHLVIYHAAAVGHLCLSQAGHGMVVAERYFAPWGRQTNGRV